MVADLHPGAVRRFGWSVIHCGERLITDDDTVRISIAWRSAFTRLPAFKRSATSVRLEFLELLVLFECGIVIFPPGPGAARSSRESNSSELLTWITLSIFFPLLPLLVTLPPVLAVARETGSNGGTLLSG